METAWLEWLQRLGSSSTKITPILTGFTRCAKDYHIAERTLDEHLIYQMVEYDLHAQLEDREYVVEQGALFCVPPGIRHEFRAFEPGKQLLVYHYRFQVAAECPLKNAIVLPRAPARIGRFAGLLDGRDHQDPWWLIRFRACMVQTYWEIAQHDLLHDQSQPNGLNSEQRRQIMHAVQNNAWIEVDELAQLCDYHPAYFTRIFKKTFGLAPRTWIMQQRMAQARVHLSETTAAINHIAQEFGYEDPFVFSRQFKQVYGLSPRDWRKAHVAPRQFGEQG